MNKGYGGAQISMRDSVIKSETYLGPYNKMLQIGDTQVMQFQLGADGPFWMTLQERTERMYDCVSNNQIKTKKYTKAQLQE